MEKDSNWIWAVVVGCVCIGILFGFLSALAVMEISEDSATQVMWSVCQENDILVNFTNFQSGVIEECYGVDSGTLDRLERSPVCVALDNGTI